MTTAYPAIPVGEKTTQHNIRPVFIFVLSIGAFLRLFHYFSNRSLYTDEAYLANNFLYRDFGQLTQHLDASQHAPLFFLWVTKTNQLLFGNSEFVFRLFPLLCGLASLVGFYQLLKKYSLREAGMVVGLILFALAYPLLYYASEFKQYSTEVLTTILAYLLFHRFRKETTLQPLVLYTLAGSLMIWFSYPVIFVLFSIASVHLITLVSNRNWKDTFRFTWVYLVWGASFLLNLVLIIIPNSLEDNDLRNMWTDAFMPFPVRSVSELKWFGVSFFTLFDYPLNLNWTFLNEWVSHRITFSFIGLICLVVGIIYLLRTQWHLCLMLLLPVVLTLLASGLQKYPFTERFLLFLVPIFFLLIAMGAQQIFYSLQPRFGLIAGLVLVLLVAPPGITAVRDLIHENQFGGWKRREVKDVIAYLKQHRKPSEKIFINETASAFLFYNHVYGLNWSADTPPIPGMESGSAEIQAFHEKFAQELDDNTFWVVVTGDLMNASAENSSSKHRHHFLSYFTNHYHKIQDYQVKGVYVARFGK